MRISLLPVPMTGQLKSGVLISNLSSHFQDTEEVSGMLLFIQFKNLWLLLLETEPSKVGVYSMVTAYGL